MWNGDSVCWESTHGNLYECLDVDFDLYEWHQYTFLTEVWEGKAEYEAYKDTSEIDSSYDNPSINRMYDEVDFTFGASTKYRAAGLDSEWFYKGF